MILFAIAFITYIFKSIGLMRMANNRNIENAWLAWVPIADYYIIGKLIAKFKLIDKEIKKPESFLVILFVICFCVKLFLFPMALIPVVKIFYYIIVAAINIFEAIIIFMARYRLCEIYYKDRAVVYTILGFFLNPLFNIFIFTMRNNQPQLEEIREVHYQITDSNE